MEQENSIQKSEYAESEIINKIYFIRGQKVMLDRDLAEMYNVETKVLNQAVKRNVSRFPEDFMFQLSQVEAETSRSHIVTLKQGRGSNFKYLPFAFTEQGVAMLSSVLRSERAIQVNIQIIRVYIKMKQILFDNKDLWFKIEKIEQSLITKDEEVKAIFKILEELLTREEKPRIEIGFLAGRNKKDK